MRYEPTMKWAVITPMLPNKPRGLPRVNDRRVLNGIFWVLGSGAPWRELRITSVRIPLATTVRSPAAGWRLEPHHERAGHRS